MEIFFQAAIPRVNKLSSMVPNDVESDFILNYEKLYSLSAHFVKHWVIGRNNHSVEEKHLLLMIEASASYYSWVNGEFSYKRTLNFTRTIKWLSEKK